jgi:hypothetical protein
MSNAPAPNSTMSDVFAAAARVACLAVGLLLIVMGGMYALSVFSMVSSLVRDPQGMQSPVDAMASAIKADKLDLNIQGQAISPGGTVAMICLLVWYAFLVWIPLALVKAGGRLVYWTLHAGKGEAARA